MFNLIYKIQNMYMNNKLYSNIVILNGNYDLGKTIANWLLCFNKYEKKTYCICYSCKLFSNGVHPDYNYINTEKKITIKIFEYLNCIPLVSKKRVNIIYPINNINYIFLNKLLLQLKTNIKNNYFLLISKNSDILMDILNISQKFNQKTNKKEHFSRKTFKFLYEYFYENNINSNKLNEYIFSVKNEKILDILDTIIIFFSKLILNKFVKKNKKYVKNCKLEYIIKKLSLNKIKNIFSCLKIMYHIKSLLLKNYNLNVDFIFKNILFTLNLNNKI